MASLGLPGLAGFWGEFPAILSAYQPAPMLNEALFRTLMVIGAIGTVLAAGYLLWMLQRVFLGPRNEKWDSLPDINVREMFTLVPIGLIVILMGVYPMPVLDLMKATLNNLIKVVAG